MSKPSGIARVAHFDPDQFVNQGPKPPIATPEPEPMPTPAESQGVVVNAVRTELPDYANPPERTSLTHATYKIPTKLHKRLRHYSSLCEIPMNQIVAIAIERELARIRHKLPSVLDV